MIESNSNNSYFVSESSLLDSKENLESIALDSKTISESAPSVMS